MGRVEQVTLTASEDSPSELVTLIETALPAVTFEYTELGTTTVAAVSLEGVTVTVVAEPPEGVNETIKFAVRNPVPARVSVDAAPA